MQFHRHLFISALYLNNDKRGRGRMQGAGVFHGLAMLAPCYFSTVGGGNDRRQNLEKGTAFRQKSGG
jgi:hypothetical protein